MLGKLLKYELPAMGRKLLPLYAAWIVAAFLLGLTVDGSESTAGFVLVITGLLYGSISVAIVAIAAIMIIQRYSTSLLGNEGYFYHVLPVSTSAQIGTKLISATVWVLATMVVALITGGCIILGLLVSEGITGTEIFEAIRRLLQIDFHFPENFALYVTEGFILVLASVVKTIMQIYVALTIGYQVANRTTLASIAAFIGVMIFEATLGRTLLSSFVYVEYNTDGFLDFTGVFIPSLTVAVLFSALYFFICRYLLKNRLNLA